MLSSNKNVDINDNTDISCTESLISAFNKLQNNNSKAFSICLAITLVLSVITAYFVVDAIGLFLTYIFTVIQDYDIHTGCYINDTVLNSTYVRRYTNICYNNITHTRYSSLYCSTYDDNSIWCGCFMTGVFAGFCVGIPLLIGYVIYKLYKSNTRKNNNELNINDNDCKASCKASCEASYENTSINQTNNVSVKIYDDTIGGL